jgi:predicted alpha/beta superfamily hydrolase
MLKKFFTAVLFYCGIFSILTTDNLFSQSDNIVIGNNIILNSKILDEERTIQVYLPDSYNTSKANYPVVYLMDGEGHFSYTAGLLQFFARNNMAPEMILIGVPNKFRNRDFTPIADVTVAGSGGADNFLKFLQEELIPTVEDKYRTLPYRVMIGHSLTGMYCFYTMLKKPDLFNSFVAVSPWVIYHNNFLVDFINKELPNHSSLKKEIYFTAGSLEQQDLLTTFNRFNEILKNKAPKDLTWNYKLMTNENHGSQFLLAVYDGLNKIFAGWNLPDGVASQGLESVLNHYEKLSEKFGFEVLPQEAALNNIGYFFLQSAKYDEAIKFFKKNVELYPESANVYDSLGEAYENISKNELALKNYEKAFTIAKAVNHPFLATFQKNFERAQNNIKDK